MVTGMLAAAAVNAIEALMIKVPLDSNIMAWWSFADAELTLTDWV